MAFSDFLEKIEKGSDLSKAEASLAFDAIFEGSVQADEIGRFLLGLNKKHETADELLGAVISMRSKAITIEAPKDAIDIVGTGGDAHGTLNISTAVSLVVAGLGVPVAKHGNRAASSRSGSSDVLKELGINLEPPLPQLRKCLKEANLCFLFAPRHHPAMRHVGEVRKKLGVRTIFNLLGPLTNPANVRRHLIGVYDLEWLGPMAETLLTLGSESAWLCHGHDGMDEITTTKATDVVEIKTGMIKHFTLTPDAVGLKEASLKDLKGGDAAYNASELKKLLGGQKGSYRDIVVFNASAALIVAGKASDLRKGMALAESSIDKGFAKRTLENVIRLTHETTA